MDTQIVAVYCLCDDLLKALSHPEDQQCQMSDAEVMTTAIVAALFFGGNHERARSFLLSGGYVPNMLSRSRFNRRWHRLQDHFWALFHMLGETWKQLNEDGLYIVDSFPIAVCDNYRIIRCRIYRGADWRGYQASKKRYFYGLKVHLLITKAGQPVEFFLTPASFSDTPSLKQYWLDLPEGSTITGDKAYNDYGVED